MSRERLALEAILPMIGDGARALVERALGPDAADGALLDRTIARFHEAYEAAPCAHTTLKPGARESLAIELPRALVTNKPRGVTMRLLDGLGILGAFGAIYAGGDGPLKPSPSGILMTSAALGVRASEAWIIGDGPQDVLAGRAAGAVTIAVPGIADRDKLVAANPDVLVESLVDVVRLVRSVTSA